ncbi:MAG TPA: NrfD/PsrC family molybdoenzyme membrane anchor subunit [Gemmataceae bacterium]|nr:NrfD/PsrC family molybdoenzyme membrane anchor subunit [Gemmataceae bacterium]
MDLFVADPDWHWWIILYFFCGGIAAGAYFVATLIDLVGHERERELSRVGYWIAFPLVLLCGLFLTVDLTRPERFWHMLFKSEIVHRGLEQGWPSSAQSWRTMSHALIWKYWSPMSVGAWALLIFGLCSFLSLLGSLWPDGKLAYFLRHSVVGKCFHLLGSAVGFFIAAYTGALLTATNQPLWSDTVWLAPLFLTSATTTGLATMMLLVRARRTMPPVSWESLQHAEVWALVLELIVFGIFLVSLGGLLLPVLQTGHGKLLVIGTLVLGLLLPLALHVIGGLRPQPRTMLAAICSLAGGLVLRYALLTSPPEMLARGPQLRAQDAVLQNPRIGTPEPGLVSGFSPEDGRARGGGPGADPGNKTANLEPRSKVFDAP